MAAPSVTGRSLLSGTLTAVKSAGQAATLTINGSGEAGQEITLSGTRTIGEYLGGRYTFTSTVDFSSLLLGFHSSQRFFGTTGYDSCADNGVTMRFVDTSARARVFSIAGGDKLNWNGVTSPTFYTSFLVDPSDEGTAISTDSGYDVSSIEYVELRAIPAEDNSSSLNFGNFFSFPSYGVELVGGDSGNKATFKNITDYLVGGSGGQFLVLANNPDSGLYLFSTPYKIGDGSTATLFEESGSVAVQADNGNDPTTRRVWMSAPEMRFNLASGDTASIDLATLKSSGNYKFISANSNGTQLSSGLFTSLSEGATLLAQNQSVVVRNSGMIDSANKTYTDVTFSSTTSSVAALHLKTTATLSRVLVTNNLTGAGIYINQAATFDLSDITFSGNTVDVVVDTVAATLQLSEAQFAFYPDTFVVNTINGGSVTVEGPVPTLTVTGFPNDSTVVISQAGIQRDLVNDQDSPYTYATESAEADIYTIKVVAAGFEDFIVELDKTVTTSTTWVGIPFDSTDTINTPYGNFFELMAADTAFIRVINGDQTLTKQLWTVASWQAEWDAAVVADTPTSGEIAAWVGYLTSSGYNEISFNASTGEVA